MSFFEAILLGLIQGITEFFPISSSGHLIIAEQLLGVETDHGVLFHVILHIGTLVAVLLTLKKDVKRLLYSLIGILHDIYFNGKIFLSNAWKGQERKYHKILKTQYRKMAVMILISSVFTALIGFMLSNMVAGFTGTLLVAGIGILITGLLLFVAGYSELGVKKPKTASWMSTVTVGACQGVSVVPGISRFGITIVAGMLNGYQKNFAIKYSFLVSIPTVIGAAVLELAKLPGEATGITFGFVMCCIAGAVVAAISGFFAIRTVLWIVKKRSLRVFSYYCFAVGIFVIFINYLV